MFFRELVATMRSKNPKQDMPAWRQFRWRWLGFVLIAPALVGAWILYVLGTDNFHVVVEGEAYRSGQMSSNELVRCIQRHAIRSIVNLRGTQPDQQWYQEEVLAASTRNVVHRSIALSSRKVVTAEQMCELVFMFKELPKPVLIHCDGGADRTAVAAAIYAVEVARRPPALAEKEFSMWYGYWPMVWKKKARLRDSFRAHVEHGS
jgi:protein tyrosine phosphatase (PTP) superfamily phosphohydrolase (DUF442 family)